MRGYLRDKNMTTCKLRLAYPADGYAFYTQVLAASLVRRIRQESLCRRLSH